MPDLPVQRMVLYKHGVGFFERFGQVGNLAQVELTFKKDEMNDVLKSLTAFPQGDAQVINISYETPEDKQSALNKAPIVLSNNASLLDLLRSLRGRQVCLHLVELITTHPNGQVMETTGSAFNVSGTLLGIDSETTMERMLVSILTSGADPDVPPAVRTYRLRQFQGIDLLDTQSGEDLRYVLELSRADADKRSVTILLNQPHQDLLVSYIAPTPTWRVSYRLVYTPDASTDTEAATPLDTGKLLLQGWGIVDNQLDEDLEDVNLTLIAGQPISFIYDLYTPRLVPRPQVADEERTVTGPVMFQEVLGGAAPSEDDFGGLDSLLEEPSARASDYGGHRYAAMAAAAAPKRDLAQATRVQATGIAKGELFQYDVSAPVSIKRGQSAMVPILGTRLDGRKQHLYNREKVPDHPVVTITATNSSGLTLERGPVTVLEEDNYVGEAVLAFTPAEGEFFVPYAVDLGVRITPTVKTREELAAIRWSDRALFQDQYNIITTEYAIENRNPDAFKLVIEQRIQPDYDLFEMPQPIAKTAEFYRWQIAVVARSQQTFLVQERRLLARIQNLQDLKYQTLQNYLQDHLIDRHLFNFLRQVLTLYQQMNDNRNEMGRLSKLRQQSLKEQQEAAEKLKPLDRGGEEGALRKRYVAKMQTLETDCDRLQQEINALSQRNLEIQQQIDQQLQSLS